MRAVKIDPVSRTVTEIDLKKNPNRTFEELYEIIGCDLVELIQVDANMVMVCDEEGKYKTEDTNHSTCLEHILGLDKTSRECDCIWRCRDRHKHRE